MALSLYLEILFSILLPSVMEVKALKKPSLQDFFQGVELDEVSGLETGFIEKVLLGRMMSSRPFKRFTLVEIIKHIWKTKEKVTVEKISENIFKFTFESGVDRDFVYHNRPWTLNGAHLVLKLWHEDERLEEISFDKATFFIQVHGLPPKQLVESNAKKIGSMLGELVDFDGHMVVAQRYLRFRVNIPITEPLPAGFLQEKGTGEQFWVQFKFEKLADFCYKCGLITHITGQCLKEGSEMIFLKDGRAARRFGPWMNAEKKIGIQFEFPSPDVDDRGGVPFDGMDTELQAGLPPDKSSLIGWKRAGKVALEKDTSIGEGMETSIRALNPTDYLITLKKQIMGEDESITREIVKNVGGTRVSGLQLTTWAKEMIAVMEPGTVHGEDKLLIGSSQTQPGTIHGEDRLLIGPSQTQREESQVGQSEEEQAPNVGQDQFDSKMNHANESSLIEIDVSTLSALAGGTLPIDTDTTASVQSGDVLQTGLQTEELSFAEKEQGE